MASRPKQYTSFNSYPIEAISDDPNWQKAAPSPHTNTAYHTRPYVYKHFFSRPRLLRYSKSGEITDSRGHGFQSENGFELGLLQSSNTAKIEPVGVMDVHKQMEEENSEVFAKRDWTNLFIDLLWTGIISNISDNFTSTAFEPGGSWGMALLEFSVLFFTAVKIWNYLRKFLNSFFNKDYLQSLFLTWILVLALYFGNRAPYFLEPGGSSTIIWTYLIAKYSIVGMQIFYCIFIPEIRRERALSFLLSLPITGLWIGALKLSWPSQAALVLPALMLESLSSLLVSLPVGDRFRGGEPERVIDPDKDIARLQGFFTLIIGEGVFGLIVGNDSGLGFGDKVVLSVEALIIYYVVFTLFFLGDSSKTYIHALFRNRYTAAAFESIHILLYPSVLLLDNSIKYLIRHGSDTLEESVSSKACWTVSAALSAALVCMTIATLLNRCLDGPGTLLISNRYIRLAPRAMLVVVLMCLPIKTDITTGSFLLIIMVLMLVINFWEHVVALEKGGRLFEPKEATD